MKTDKTVDSCFILPILPHKIGNVRDFWDDASEKFRDDTEGLLRSTGIKRALAFLQAIPEKGDFLILFLQSSGSLNKTLHGMFAAGDEYSEYMAGQFKDFTGVDISRKENAPQLQLLMDWESSRTYPEDKKMLTMPWCFTVPVKPGKTEALLKLLSEIKSKSRKKELEDVMRHHEILRSLTYLQRTSQGDFIVRHILASNPLDDLIMAFTACDDKKCKYARDVAMEFTGVDFSDPNSLPHVELLFKWDEKHGFETAEQTIAYTR